MNNNISLNQINIFYPIIVRTENFQVFLKAICNVYKNLKCM